MSNYICKASSLSIKDVDTATGMVSGYFSAFGILDSDGDIIQKGAYSKTIAERGPSSTHPRIKHLLDHDTTKVIGVLQELREDEIGLFYVSKLGSHTLGQDAAKMYAEGIITEHSVGFRTVNAKSDQDGTNILTEIALWEGSALQTWGANQYTPVTRAKSLIKTAPDQVFARMDKLAKALYSGTYTDETMQLFEIEYNQLKQAIKDTLNQEPEPTSTPPTSEPVQVADLFKSFRKTLNL
jgi:uncharacterized protein